MGINFCYCLSVSGNAGSDPAHPQPAVRPAGDFPDWLREKDEEWMDQTPEPDQSRLVERDDYRAGDLTTRDRIMWWILMVGSVLGPAPTIYSALNDHIRGDDSSAILWLLIYGGWVIEFWRKDRLIRRLKRPDSA
jgi:hypothetical protein